MAVTQAQLAVIQRFLARQATIARCPFCGASGWEVVDIAEVELRVPPEEAAGYPRIVAGLTVRTLAAIFPVVLLACRQCAFIAQFSWRRIEADRG